MAAGVICPYQIQILRQVITLKPFYCHHNTCMYRKNNILKEMKYCIIYLWFYIYFL